MSKIKNFVVFNSTIEHGQMNTNKNFYPGIEDENTRVKLMREHKQRLADEVGFNKNHIFMSLQANKKHPYIPGTSYTITPEDVAHYEDLYDYDVYSDTVRLTSNTPNVVIGFNVSDGANVIAMNLKTKEAISTFCSGSHINKQVPFTIASTLGGNPLDIVVDVSPFAYILPFKEQNGLKEPHWVSNAKVWEGCLDRNSIYCIEDQKQYGSYDILYIDQKKALLRQLVESGIKEENIYVREDSLQNPNYYSSQRARLLNNPSYDGRFMHGVMFEKEGEEREYPQSYIKKYATK